MAGTSVSFIFKLSAALSMRLFKFVHSATCSSTCEGYGFQDAMLHLDLRCQSAVLKMKYCMLRPLFTGLDKTNCLWPKYRGYSALQVAWVQYPAMVFSLSLHSQRL